LDRSNISYQRIEIDGARPDLTKFDGMLGQIAMASPSRAAAVLRQQAVEETGAEEKAIDQETKNDEEFVLL
jgi:hypothetical protein